MPAKSGRGDELWCGRRSIAAVSQAPPYDPVGRDRTPSATLWPTPIDEEECPMTDTAQQTLTAADSGYADVNGLNL